MGHGGGLVPLTAVQSRGQRELAVRPSWLQTATSGSTRTRSRLKFKSAYLRSAYFYTNVWIIRFRFAVQHSWHRSP